MKKKRILLGLSAFALVGLAAVLSSCDGQKKYTVKFVDGQEEITKTEVTGGYNVAVPEAPTADGKTFNGWYKDAALTDPFDFGSIINGDTTVYAAWLNEYGVTFKSGDATYLIKPVTKGYNVAVPTAPTKEGYVFAGWYADAAFTTPFYFGTVIEADTTVYAKWVEEVVTYTVTYVSEQGTAPAAVELVTLPETLPTLEADSYEFGGWYLDETFETAAAAGTALTEDVTLYAKWTSTAISFENLSAHAGCILKSDFTEETIKTYENYQPGNKGFYNHSTGTDAEDQAKLVVAVSDGKLSVTDASASTSAEAMAEIGFNYAGVLEGVMKYTPCQSENKTNSKWAMIQFYGYQEFGNETKLFALGTNGDKKIQVLINKTSEYVGTAMDYTPGTEYDITWKYDFNTSKLSIKVGETEIVSDYELAEASRPVFLTGVSFVTANSDTKRSAKVDDFAVANTEEVAFVDLKTKLVAILDQTYTGLNIATNYTHNGEQVTTLYNTCKANINASETSDAALAALLAYGAYNNIDDDAKYALKEAKTQKVADLTAYFEGKTFEMYTALTTNVVDPTAVVSAFQTAIADLKTVEAVGTAYDIQVAAYANIFDASTAEYQDGKTILAVYTASLKANITETYKSTDYTESATAYAAILTAFDNAEITSKATADAAQQTALTAMSALKTDEVLVAETKVSSKAALDAYKTEEIAQEDQSTQDLIATQVSNGKDAIDAATTLAGIETALTTAKGEVDKLIVPLADVIANYNTELTTTRTGLLETYDGNTFFTNKVNGVTTYQVSSTTATTKAKALEEYTAINNAFKAISDEYTAKQEKISNLEDYLADAIDDLLIDAATYELTYKTEVDAILATQKGNINEADLADLDTVYTTATTAIDNEFNTIKAATESVVTFKKFAGDTDAYETVRVLKNATVETTAKPTDPTADNLAFVHWCTDNTLATEFEFGTTTVPANITLYAKWNDTYNNPVYKGMTRSYMESLTAVKPISTVGHVNLTESTTTDYFEYLGNNSSDEIKVDADNGNKKAIYFNGNVKSIRYLKIVLSKETTITVSFRYTGTDKKCWFGSTLTSTAPTQNAENETYGLFTNGSSTGYNAEKSQTVTLPAGTWYFNSTDKLYIYNIASVEYEAVAVNDISATITPKDNTFAISDVKITLANSNEVAISSGYDIEVRDDSNNIILDYSGNLTPNTNYQVTIKYGEYTKEVYQITTLQASTAYTKSVIATNLTATVDKEEITQAELDNFFTLVGTGTKRLNGSVYAIEFNNAGLQFTVENDVIVTLVVTSTGGTNMSLAAIYDSNNNAVEAFNVSRVSGDIIGVTNNVYDVYGTKNTVIKYVLSAGTYTAKGIQGTTTGGTYDSTPKASEDITRNTRFISLTINSLEQINENKTFEFRKDTSTGNEITTSYNGSYGVINDTLFVDASKGKLDPRNEQYAQFNNGTILAFYVKAGAYVTVNGHSTLTDFSITGENSSQSITASHYYTEDTLVTVKANVDGYIDNITIIYPLENENITFGNEGNYDSYLSKVDSNVTNGKNNGYSQVKNGSIILNVKANSTITINGYYSVDYDISIAGGTPTSVQGTDASSLTKVFETGNSDCLVTITCQTGNNSYGNGNYFESIVIAPKSE